MPEIPLFAMENTILQGEAMKAGTLILATRNKGKILELRTRLADFGFEVLGLPDNFPEIEENGTTFEENALIKARTVAEALGVPAAADDSGLEVDALGGEPGVYSARYSDDIPSIGEETKDEKNNRKLLEKLLSVPDEKRTARFRCCMAIAWPGDSHPPITSSGVWEGRIIHEPQGLNGFGYDPLFLDTSSGKTGAELTREEKHLRSHRGQAVERILEKLLMSRED